MACLLRRAFNLRGWQFTTEKRVHKGRVFLRLRKVDGLVDMYFSNDGEKWIKIENSLEVSGYHHNVLGGFMSLRLELVAIGEGKVKFRDFRYQPIK
jgi:xylan 1,4-beta-xylosidase